MADIERCASPEQIPPLEPLSEVNSLHDTSSSPPAFSGISGSVTPSASKQEKVSHDMSPFMEHLKAPLRLSLVLENKGNVARDHLASERTYLAYVRTSLATASAGVALVQLFTLAPTGKSGINLAKWAKPLGATIIMFALFILVLGVVRYFVTQSALVRGCFPVTRHSVTVVAFVLGSLVGIVFGALIAGSR